MRIDFIKRFRLQAALEKILLENLVSRTRHVEVQALLKEQLVGQQPVTKRALLQQSQAGLAQSDDKQQFVFVADHAARAGGVAPLIAQFNQPAASAFSSNNGSNEQQSKGFRESDRGAVRTEYARVSPDAGVRANTASHLTQELHSSNDLIERYSLNLSNAHLFIRELNHELHKARDLVSKQNACAQKALEELRQRNEELAKVRVALEASQLEMQRQRTAIDHAQAQIRGLQARLEEAQSTAMNSHLVVQTHRTDTSQARREIEMLQGRLKEAEANLEAFKKLWVESNLTK